MAKVRRFGKANFEMRCRCRRGAKCWPGLEFLLQTALGGRVAARIFRDGDELHTPHLADVEVVQALRRLTRIDEVSAARASEAIAS